jgi:hypothetical protein
LHLPVTIKLALEQLVDRVVKAKRWARGLPDAVPAVEVEAAFALHVEVDLRAA